MLRLSFEFLVVVTNRGLFVTTRPVVVALLNVGNGMDVMSLPHQNQSLDLRWNVSMNGRERIQTERELSEGMH